jgi:hypothetical protein
MIGADGGGNDRRYLEEQEVTYVSFWKKLEGMLCLRHLDRRLSRRLSG